MVNTVENIGKVFLLFGPTEKFADPDIRSFKLRHTMCLSSALRRGMLGNRTLCLQAWAHLHTASFPGVFTTSAKLRQV